MEIERRLLIVLSDYFLKQAQFNAVVNQTIKMDRVGVEATTSGLYRLCKRANDERELKCSNSTQSTFSFCLPPSMYTINRNFEELAKAVKTRQKVWTVLVLFSVW
jgi:hypothetical protein